MRDQDYIEIKKRRKVAFRNKDFAQTAYYDELLNKDISAAVSWERFKGSWAFEQWMNSEKTKKAILALESDYKRNSFMWELKSMIRECIMETLKEHHIESETKKVDGTVNFNGDDYDYSAEVNYNVEVGTERHGEDYAIVDEDSIEVEVLSIDPEPLDLADEEAIGDMIEDDVRSKV